jgi:alpha-glucosidase (family GH31 glycosyl hydrolase)
MRFGFCCPIVVFVLAGCGDPELPLDTTCRYAEPIDSAEPAPITTPRWAFEPWISKDISSTDDTYDFVAGFQARDIPVGVVVLDSPWETHYNTFIPHPERYHDFDALLGDLRDDGIRVVLWITQMVNSQSFDLEEGGDSYLGSSPNFEQGLDCGFYVNGGETYGWWKGKGAGVDFFHPEARGWWHRQQDHLFDLGVAGFKLDFGESYITTDTVETFAGTQPHQAYSEAYYRDFFAYGAARVGLEDYVTMVRPYDKSYEFEGRFFARPEHASVGWVGDNRRDWIGLEDALDHLFRSAEAGYVVIGSDIGGYLDRDDENLLGPEIPFSTVNFQRWTAVGALTPFMQLHGRANITPWTVPGDAETTVAVYRYWASLHHQLVPFFYSLSEEAYAAGEASIHPVGDAASWPGDYRFMVGDALLVAPILDDTGIRDVALPSGRWIDWWAPDADPIEGGQLLASYDASEPHRVPLFVKEGAIIPLTDASEVTELGTSASRGLSTVLVYPAAGPSTFHRHDEDGAITTISAQGSAVTLSRVAETTYLRIRRESVPASVGALTAVADRAALDAAASGWFYEPATRSVWVKLAASGEVTVALEG